MAERQSGLIISYTNGNQISEQDETYHESSLAFSDLKTDSSVATFDTDVYGGELYAISNTHGDDEITSRVLVSKKRGRSRDAFPVYVLAGPSKASYASPPHFKLVSKTRCEVDAELFFIATSHRMFQLPARGEVAKIGLTQGVNPILIPRDFIRG